MDTEALGRAAARASQQYGLITWRQALEAGLSAASVRRLVGDGLWIRVAKGLYRINGVKANWRGRMMAACLQAGDDAVISHRSAAALWALDGFGPPTTVDVTVPPGQRPRIGGAVVHRRPITRRLVRDAIPLTPIPETILDLCAVCPNPGIPLRALDDVRRRNLVSSFELERCLAEHARSRLPGLPLYRQPLERRLGRTPPGTVFAAEVLDLLVAAGLPEPEAEVWVTINRRRYRIDLAYRRLKIAIECLGKIGHLNERAFEEDPVRSNDFALDGWLQLLVTYRRRKESPQSVVAEVEAALAVRGAAWGRHNGGMASCARCGSELPAAARFCPTCGRPVDPEFGPPAPPSAPPIWSGLRLPGWLTSDWPLAGLGVAVMLAVLFTVSALFGAVAGVATSGKFGAAGYGAAVGSHLAFAAFGAQTAVNFGTENGSRLALGFLALPWAVAGGLAMGAALRFARPRLPDERRRRIAFVAKLAAAGGVALGIIAGLLDQRSETGSGYRSELNGGEVWFYATVLGLLWGWFWLRRQGDRIGPALPARHRPLAQRAGEGATTFVAVAAAFGFVGLVFALVVVDRDGAQVGLLFGMPVVGLNFGAAMADFAMGGALGLGTPFGQPVGHLSLVHYGLPPAPDAGAAPVWLFAVLLVAPAAVAAVVWRQLEHVRPTQEQDALAVGAATAAGFAVAGWLLALVGRIALIAAIDPPGTEGGPADPLALLRGRGSGIGTLVAAQPNPVSVLFLALLWGLVGGLGAAFLWASRHNARWQTDQGAEAGGDPEEKP